MNPYWKLRGISLLVGLALAVVGLTGWPIDAAAGTLPNDVCALVAPAEIQILAANAKIGNGVLDKSAAPLGIACTYSWGPRTSEWGESALTITVIDASKAWGGMSPELIEQGVLAKVKTGGADASQISGVGDAAAFTFEARSFNATAEAYFKAKDLHLSVKYHGGNGPQNKEKIVTLLKDAAARL